MSLATSPTNHRHRQRSATTKTTKSPVSLTSGLTTLIVTIIFFLAFFSLRASQQQAKISEQSLNKLEQEIKILESDLEQSRQATANNQSDLAREKVIRNELLGQKPGEVILQVPEKEQLPSTHMLKTINTPMEDWKKLLF